MSSSEQLRDTFLGHWMAAQQTVCFGIEFGRFGTYERIHEMKARREEWPSPLPKSYSSTLIKKRGEY